MTYRIDKVFSADGDQWRVKAITEQYAVATRTSVVGEPESAEDIKVIRLNGHTKKA